MPLAYTEKRILTDIKLFRNSGLESNGIYCHFNDSNIRNLQSLIIGPSDSPYEKGFYFFDITFPNNYPIEPPKVKFMTLDNLVRFNPNLYKCGKVCLSILGTWSGPGWTSCMNLNQVLLSIQSLLHEHPIQNEPGWESETGQRSKDYNALLEYYNYTVAIIKMIKKTPYGYEEFKPIMMKSLIDNLDFHVDKLNSLVKFDNKTIKSSIYSMNDIVNYSKILDELKFLVTQYDTTINPVIFDRTLDNTKEIKKNTKKYQRKAPDESSKNYDVGFTMVSVNDNKTYKVLLRNNGSKYWKKIIA